MYYLDFYTVYLFLVSIFILFHIVCDVNYFLRTFFTVLCSRVQRKYNINEVTSIYDVGTFLDCDVSFKYVRLARLVRALDFARYHFYDRTGIYQRSVDYNIKSLQGCTLTVTMEPIPIFCIYRIDTKLVYWDDQSLFFEHEIITLFDSKCRCKLVSRQHAIGENGESTGILLKDIPFSSSKPKFPNYILKWVKSMRISSEKLRINKSVQK